MKPVIFISHISEETEVATAIKELLAPHFLDLLDFFVSSDGASISMGQKWLDSISSNLRNCAVEIVVCSPVSVKRPWVNFEAGAAWIRDIPVIPLCHSGMSPSELPVPLSLLQSAKLTDIGGLSLVVPVLAKALGAAAPKVDFDDFVQRIKAFEEQYTFWDECNRLMSVLYRVDKGLIGGISSNGVIEMGLPETTLASLDKISGFLQAHDILTIQRIGRSSLTPNGTFYGCAFRKLTKFDEIVNSPHFKPEA